MNKLGIPAEEIDKIFDRAIRAVGEDSEAFSCIALRQGEVRTFYREVMEVDLPSEPGEPSSDKLLYAVLCFAARKRTWLCFELTSYLTPKQDVKARDLRIVMLSLMKAAWRDLV